MTLNDVRIARITGACGLACVALSVGQFPLGLGDYPSFYDAPGFARHMLAIKNIAFTRILVDQGIYVSMLVFAGPRHLIRQARSDTSKLPVIAQAVSVCTGHVAPQVLVTADETRSRQ